MQLTHGCFQLTLQCCNLLFVNLPLLPQGLRTPESMGGNKGLKALDGTVTLQRQISAQRRNGFWEHPLTSLQRVQRCLSLQLPLDVRISWLQSSHQRGPRIYQPSVS